MSRSAKTGPIALACRRCQRVYGRDRAGFYPEQVYRLVRTGRTKPLGKKGKGRGNRPTATLFHEMRCGNWHVFWTLHHHATIKPLSTFP